MGRTRKLKQPRGASNWSNSAPSLRNFRETKHASLKVPGGEKLPQMSCDDKGRQPPGNQGRRPGWSPAYNDIQKYRYFSEASRYEKSIDLRSTYNSMGLIFYLGSDNCTLYCTRTPEFDGSVDGWWEEHPEDLFEIITPAFWSGWGDWKLPPEELNPYRNGELINDPDSPYNAGIGGSGSPGLIVKYPAIEAFTIEGQNLTYTFDTIGPPAGGEVYSDEYEDWIILIENTCDPDVIIGAIEYCTFYSNDVSRPTPEEVCGELPYGEAGSDIAKRFTVRNGNTIIYQRLECCHPEVTTSGGVNRPEFTCSCPDWSQTINYKATLTSNERLRNWRGSNARALNDCKHIMAAKRTLGISLPKFTDYPFDYQAPPSIPG